jgi:REP element-mobilizing transposase RayT
MANTYTQIYLHIVFAVKDRQSLLSAPLRVRVWRYIDHILTRANHHVKAIGGVDDHIHILIGYNPSQSLPDLIKEIKVSSTKFITNTFGGNFAWQRGYSCFSYSPSHIPDVVNYIHRQSEHHKNVTLRDEIISIYNKFSIPYDPQYIFINPPESPN